MIPPTARLQIIIIPLGPKSLNHELPLYHMFRPQQEQDDDKKTCGNDSNSTNSKQEKKEQDQQQQSTLW